MAKKKNNKTGSAPTSERNRETARALNFKNTTAARAAGVPLPTKAEIDDQEINATRPKVPAYRPRKR